MRLYITHNNIPPGSQRVISETPNPKELLKTYSFYVHIFIFMSICRHYKICSVRISKTSLFLSELRNTRATLYELMCNTLMWSPHMELHLLLNGKILGSLQGPSSDTIPTTTATSKNTRRNLQCSATTVSLTSVSLEPQSNSTYVRVGLSNTENFST